MALTYISDGLSRHSVVCVLVEVIEHHTHRSILAPEEFTCEAHLDCGLDCVSDSYLTRLAKEQFLSALYKKIVFDQELKEKLNKDDVDWCLDAVLLTKRALTIQEVFDRNNKP
jgi:hypothetical protein